MEMPLSEITDRFSILVLKWIHGVDVKAELMKYASECPVTEEFFDILKINAEIWGLESDIRQGKEGVLGLEEVGKRALAIRNKNRDRIEVKNKIAAISKTFREIKVSHASQD